MHDDDRVQAVSGAVDNLEALRTLALTSYAGEVRCQDEAILRALIAEAAAPRRLSGLDAALGRVGVTYSAGRATMAWMLKYGLLRVVDRE